MTELTITKVPIPGRKTAEKGYHKVVGELVQGEAVRITGATKPVNMRPHIYQAAKSLGVRVKTRLESDGITVWLEDQG
jgi:hypothetical protein